MDKKTVFIKTAKGENEISNLSGDLRRALSLIDNRSTVDEVFRRAPPSLREDLHEVLGELLAGEYIRDRDRAVSEPKIVAPKITPPKITQPKMFVPKPAGSSGELDFTSLASGSTEAKPMGKDDEAALARAELEIAMAQSGNKMPTEDEESKQARLKAKVAAAEKARSSLEAGIDAAKARASAEAAAKAEAKARQEAEMAARARAAAEAKALQEATIRAQAEAKAKMEAAARARAEQEAARAKSALEAAARAKAEAEAKVRAEIEAAAKAKQIAEAKAKQEAAEAKARQEAEAARLKAEDEAARVRAELEAAAKAKAEAEAARVKAELEAARVKAELEAAKARAEAEAKALAETIAKQEAEEKARREAEAARIKAEQEAAAARLRAEQEAEAARLRAEQEAAAKAKLEAEAKAKAETEARRKAAEAEEQARKQAAAASNKNKGSGTGSFKLDLDQFSENVPAAEPPRMLDDERANQAKEKAEAEAKSKREAEQRAVEQQAKAESGEKAKKDMAAEMARLKAEADAARLKAEEEARRQAEERALAEEQAKAWAEAEQRALAQAKIDAEMAAQQAALAQAKQTTKSAPRAKRAPLPWGKIGGGLVVLALIVAIALPYVYPLQEYIPMLEQRLATQLKQPVKIGAMSAASIPPKLRLQNVTVGIEQEVKVASVELNFDLLSLLSETRVISDAVLDDVSIKGNQLERFAPSMMLVGGDKQFPVRHLSLRKVKLVTEEMAMPNLSGVAELDAQGAFSRVALHSDDEKYNFDLQPVGGHWQLGVSLKETALPWLPGVVFSDLNAKGRLGEGEVDFAEIDGHIFKGILLGNAKLNWRKGWQLQGRLEAKLFELDKMFPGNGIEGEMYGEGTFAFSGGRFSQLGESPRLDASFSVKGGNVNAIDMVETARLLSREHMVGGRTRFDDMIGVVQVENHVVRFRQIKILSNMLSANGSFEVGTGGQLSGSFNAEIKMRAGNNALTLFGTLAEPKLRAGH